MNREYAEFVGLSTNLVDVDAAAARLLAPVEELRARLEGAAAAVAAARERLGGALQRRAEAAEARATLELLLDTSNVLSKVEKLLEEVDAAGAAPERENANPQNASAAADHAALLERVASEVNRLQFCAQRGARLPFVQGLRPRIEAADMRLGQLLGRSLERGLAGRDAAVLTRCLHAYAAVGKAEEAEGAVRRTLVAPLVARLLGADSAARSLEEVLTTLVSAVRTELAFIMEIVAREEAMAAFCFPAGSVLAEATEALVAKRPGAFSAGVPATFLSNYNAGLAFLDGLEALAGRPGSPAAQAFRVHAAVVQFASRWNLSVYFTLCFKELAESLDTAVAPASAGSDPAPAGAAGHGFALRPTAACWAAMQRCWADDCFVPALADRFLKLSLQLLARYATWLRAGVRARRSIAAEAEGEAVGDDAAVLADTSGGEWALALTTADALMQVHHDATTLASRARRELAAVVRARLSHAPEDVVVGVAAAVREGADALDAQMEGLVEAAVALVVARCAEALKQLRGIATTYRMTNKPMPTRPSAYVAAVLRPLVEVLEGERRAFLSEGARAALVEGAVAELTRRYAALAHELVTTVRKTESSLQRLRKGQAGAGDGGAANGPSDTDKICRQLALDAEHYGNEMAKLGVTASEIPAFAELMAATSNEADATSV